MWPCYYLLFLFLLQFSDSDSEADFSPVVVPPVPSAVPVTGESYCGCDSQAETSYNPRLRGFHQVKDCHCGEDDQGKQWILYSLGENRKFPRVINSHYSLTPLFDPHFISLHIDIHLIWYKVLHFFCVFFRVWLGLGYQQPINGNFIELWKSESELPLRIQLWYSSCSRLQGTGWWTTLLGNQDDISSVWNRHGKILFISKQSAHRSTICWVKLFLKFCADGGNWNFWCQFGQVQTHFLQPVGKRCR